MQLTRWMRRAAILAGLLPGLITPAFAEDGESIDSPAEDRPTATAVEDEVTDGSVDDGEPGMRPSEVDPAELAEGTPGDELDPATREEIDRAIESFFASEVDPALEESLAPAREPVARAEADDDGSASSGADGAEADGEVSAPSGRDEVDSSEEAQAAVEAGSGGGDEAARDDDADGTESQATAGAEVGPAGPPLDEEALEVPDEEEALAEAMSYGPTGQVPAAAVAPDAAEDDGEAPEVAASQADDAESAPADGATPEEQAAPEAETGLVQALEGIDSNQAAETAEGEEPKPETPLPEEPPRPGPPGPVPVPSGPPGSPPAGGPPETTEPEDDEWNLDEPETTVPAPEDEPVTDDPAGDDPVGTDDDDAPDPAVAEPDDDGATPPVADVPETPADDDEEDEPISRAPSGEDDAGPTRVPSSPRGPTRAPSGDGPGNAPSGPVSGVPSIPDRGRAVPVRGEAGPPEEAAEDEGGHSEGFFLQLFARLLEVVDRFVARNFSQEASAARTRADAFAGDLAGRHPEAKPYIEDRVDDRFDRSVADSVDGTLPPGRRVTANPDGGVTWIKPDGAVFVSTSGRVSGPDSAPDGWKPPASRTSGRGTQPKPRRGGGSSTPPGRSNPRPDRSPGSSGSGVPSGGSSGPQPVPTGAVPIRPLP